MKARVEPFGAWVRLPGALAAVDQARARRLGLDGGALWAESPPGPPTAPLEVHLAVNARCGVGCEGCYLDATPQGASPGFDEIVERIYTLARAGVFTVAFGGGEPLLRRDLGRLAGAARGAGLVPVMTTSGAGLTAERAAELRAFEQVNVSHDGVEGGYRAVRGVEGAARAEEAIGLLAAAGVRVGVNLTLTRQNFEQVEATAARVKGLGAVELQLLRYKPSGRGARVDYLARRLQPVQIEGVSGLLTRLVRGSGMSVRVDCSMIPWLSAGEGAGELGEALERFGIFGCEAGRHLSAATVGGEVAPCSFLDAVGLDVAGLPGGFRGDPGLVAARSRPEGLGEPCASCELREACRGGCAAVARWYGDPAGPDPECPRVAAARGEPGGRRGEG